MKKCRESAEGPPQFRPGAVQMAGKHWRRWMDNVHWGTPMKRVILAAISVLLLTPTLPPAAAARPVVEVAFVLDTTGSMASLIEGAKRKIWSIATSIIDANPDAEIRMGLVAYRDIGDEYVTRTYQLTTDIQDLYAQLLEFKARGGGDWPESVNEALLVGMTKLAWSNGPESARILFLVGDAPPHMDYAQDTKYPDVMEIARQRGIIVNAVQAGRARDTERVWQEIAQMGNGRYIPIPQSGGQVLIIETPFDEEIIELQSKLNGTVIPYGPRAQRERVVGKTKQVMAAPPAAASDMASFINKRARSARAAEAVTGEGDLVADVVAGRKQLSAVKEDELPDRLRAMSAAERKAFVDRQMAERKDISARMSEIVKRRDAYVREKRTTAPALPADSFDRAVEETLRAQIRR
jgi:hypothetical protein